MFRQSQPRIPSINPNNFMVSKTNSVHQMVTGKACERSGLWEGGIRVWSPSGKFSLYPTPTWCHLSLSVTHMLLGKNMYTIFYHITLYLIIFYNILYCYISISYFMPVIFWSVFIVFEFMVNFQRILLPRNMTVQRLQTANHQSIFHINRILLNRTCMSGTAQNQSKQLSLL